MHDCKTLLIKIDEKASNDDYFKSLMFVPCHAKFISSRRLNDNIYVTLESTNYNFQGYMNTGIVRITMDDGRWFDGELMLGHNLWDNDRWEYEFKLVNGLG